MYELNAAIDTSAMKVVATGHCQQMERWEDDPNGRRSTGQPLIDDATGAPVRIYDVLLETGRDGRAELHGLRILNHETPEIEPYAPVEIEGLTARVRQARNGGKGIEVWFSAESIRPASTTAATRTGRRTATETTEAARDALA